ncbi:unnamed protein product [Bursaphelenchus xylophilus]|uniref:(pine wood nematode) hypothetical protein n=1 Tax=Bursaphelenchus xylophilus TaxID=6326 RepID=A0A1I7RS47_BURXY|nr:unnamed protein product [Bursaphelenchus xylophilus]CAG9123223.1 unnamed protein product [Bursaphelenchus xylophilus]
MGRDRSRSGERTRRSRSRSLSVDDGARELWRVVKDDPYSFDGWTRLLQYVEQKDELDQAEGAYESFLKRYPFCYGYWRKYAEMQKRHKKYEKALNVYERGLQEISLSVDLWLSYISYIKEIAQGQRQADAKIRAIYLRALEACGMEFRSDKLWTQYIDWEIENGEYQKASQVYDIVLSTPTQGYIGHFERYRRFVEEREPDEILSMEEYEAITDKIYDKIKNDLDGAPLFIIEEFEEDISDEEVIDESQTKRTVTRRKHMPVALIAYRDEIIDRRTKLHLANEVEINSRLKYENSIRRPYFHVKPLERDQLSNWYKYLDFEIKEKKKKRIQVLFERCVISCALYEEMWIKYAVYLDSIKDTDGAREVFKRASEVHCSRKPGIHLAYSLFEEKHGDYGAAAAILYDFDRQYPGYASISLRKIHVSRRKNGKDKSPDYSSTISKFEKLMNEPGNSRRVSSFYAMKLARIHLKLRHDKKAAEKVIKEAISRDKDNLQLYMTLVDIAFSSSRFHERDVCDAFDFAIDSRYLSVEQKFIFSQRKLDFLEDLGNDPGKLQTHYLEHLKLEKELDEPAPTLFSNLKRKASFEEEVDSKRLKEGTDSPSDLVNTNNSFARTSIGNGDGNGGFYSPNVDLSGHDCLVNTPTYPETPTQPF